MQNSDKSVRARAREAHHHTMRCVGYRGNFAQLIFRCRCGNEAERPPTPAERRVLEREQCVNGGDTPWRNGFMRALPIALGRRFAEIGRAHV